MNASELISHLRNHKAVLNVQHGKLKIRALEIVMTPEVMTDIKAHKAEIIAELKAAKDELKRFVYQYKFKDGDGGTWITDVPPKKVSNILSGRFPKHEVESITNDWVN